jgi:hypothetical protein
MHIESILRRLHRHPGFVYDRVEWTAGRQPALHIHVRPRRGARGVCSGCGRKRRGYDTLTERLFTFVPLWGIAVFLHYAMRRVDCFRCGVTVEMVPWAEGKSQTTHAFVWFVSSWAKVLSWWEVAQRFGTTLGT